MGEFIGKFVKKFSQIKMGKHKRERSDLVKRKRRKNGIGLYHQNQEFTKNHIKNSRKLKKSKDSLPSIDDIISSKIKEKQMSGATTAGEPSVNLLEEKPKKSLAPMTKEQFEEKQSI